jgi:hypothetical protein
VRLHGRGVFAQFADVDVKRGEIIFHGYGNKGKVRVILVHGSEGGKARSA